MAAEIPFEFLAFALEGAGTKGTPVTPPTHFTNLQGVITPTIDIAMADEARGTLEASYREKVVRRGSTWKGTGPLDLNVLPALLTIFSKNVTSPSTPSGATLTRDWTHVPSITSDDLRSFTGYWGDPNETVFQTAYTMGETLVITADASGTDLTMIEASGWGRFPVDLGSPPTAPSQSTSGLLAPANMQAWADTTSAIGTTALAAGLIRAKHTIPTGAVAKWFARGLDDVLSFTKHGRKKRRITTEIEVELEDLVLWTAYKNGVPIKLRVQHLGPFIETVTGPIDYYSYLVVDTYGLIRDWAWGDMEGANRTASFSVQSTVDTTLGASWQIKVRNGKATL